MKRLFVIFILCTIGLYTNAKVNAVKTTIPGINEQLQDDEIFNGNPAWAPDGEHIAFTSNRDGNSDIWVMEADGSNPTNLTSDSQERDYAPVWSPDGNYIAFQSHRAGYDVWIMEADGSNLVNASAIELGREFSHTWSLDGNYLAFLASNLRGLTEDMFVVSPDGTERKWLLADVEELIVDYSWAPDSEHIAYITAFGNPAELHIIDLEGNEVNSIELPRLLVDIAWSPSDPVILGTDSLNIWQINVNDGTIENLTERDDLTTNHAPVWSPDGSAIAFVSDRDHSNTEIEMDIWVMSAEGDAALNLTFDTGGYDRLSSWSPDGSMIAFESQIGATVQIFTVNRDGSKLVQVTE